MDWFTKKEKPVDVSEPTPTKPVSAAAPTTPSTPPKASPSKSAATVIDKKELDELHKILSDSTQLNELVASGLKNGTLEDTSNLESLSDLSARLLSRNRCRSATAKFGTSLLADKHTEPINLAAGAMLPSYFRHEQTPPHEEEGGQTDLWVSKIFMHEMAAPPQPGTVLCARFSLSASIPAGQNDEPLYDLSIKVMQVRGRTEHKYAFHFEMVDVSAASAGDWTLDDSQRAKLTELQECLGLKSGRWTPIGMLGVLLAAGGCAQLDENPCFSVVLRACKDAHREELLAQSGSLF